MGGTASQIPRRLSELQMEEFFSPKVGTKKTPPPGLDAAKAFAHGAAEYLWAAKHLDASGKPDGTAEYMVLFHAIELGLKAFLLKNGVSKKGLSKKYRHDLIKLLQEAKRHGLSLATPNADDMIEWIHKWHSEKAKIRYEFQTEQFQPLCNAIFPLAEEIIAAT
jgi:hypothetical protein